MKNFLRILALGALLFGGATFALAQQTNDNASNQSALSKVTYPVSELGNCDSRDACKLYCDDSSHQTACFAFALKAGLMSQEKINIAKLVLSKKGPGSCGSRDECATYCSDSAHQDECLSFAQQHNVIASSTVSLIKRLNSGEGPGACKSSATCKMYCEDSSHESECRSFAEETGLIKPMGSSTPMKTRMGTSTSDEVHAILASTTPGRDRGLELHDRASSTTPSSGQPHPASSTPLKPSAGSVNGVPKPPLPPKPVATTTFPHVEDDSLGAIVLRGFVRLLGF